MKWLDLPPFWLVLMLALGRCQDSYLPTGPEAPGLLRALGIVLVVTGMAITGLAVLRFFRARTTVIPHRTASSIVTTGIYRLSRNPIYLSDAMMLTGCLLYWGAWPSLLLIPLFMWIITRRFIRPEEAWLRHGFPEDFKRYAAEVRRWL